MATEAGAGRSVLVTGSSTGIGAACALDLDRRGYRVYAGVRSAADGQRLQSAASPRLTPLILDITDAGAIAAAARRLADELAPGGLWGLVNNAGIVVAGPLEILPLAELRRQLEVNVVGHVAVIQALLPLVRAARGRIVNISSANGALAVPFLGPYSASKHALEALSDSLRLEVARWGIHVSLVVPGQVQSPIWKKSQSAADAVAGGVSSAALDLYRADLDAVRTATERFARAAEPPDKVVRAVADALASRRPKTRYFCNWWTRFSFKGLRMVPDRLRDRIIRRAMGLATS